MISTKTISMSDRALKVTTEMMQLGKCQKIVN
jgi:hypothetical protein